MNVTPDLVAALARLARVDLPEGERAALSPTLDSLVGYFERLAGRPGAGGPDGRPGLPLRADEAVTGSGPALLAEACPAWKRDHVLVPRVVSKEPRRDG